MKAFAFSLQKILSLREFKEQEAELALGRANSIRDGIQLKLEEVARKRMTSVFERQGSISIQDLVSIERFISRLDIKKEKLLEELAAAELIVEKMREKYIQATMEKKIITKLKEKKEAVWHKENLDSEAAILDDIVNFRGRR